MADEQDESGLLGRRHPLIVRLRALRRDADLRRSEAVLVAEGVHLAQEALASGVAVEAIIASPRLTRNEEGRQLLRRITDHGLSCLQTSDAGVHAPCSGRTVVEQVFATFRGKVLESSIPQQMWVWLEHAAEGMVRVPDVDVAPARFV